MMVCTVLENGTVLKRGPCKRVVVLVLFQVWKREQRVKSFWRFMQKIQKKLSLTGQLENASARSSILTNKNRQALRIDQ